MRKTVTGLLAGLSLALTGGVSIETAGAEELTIFWAEWDPANYLQELANEYTKETGVTVTVQTTPWGDFQTKTFAELNAHGDAYDMVVGDSQWLGAASTGGHYVDLTDFVTKNGVDRYPTSRYAFVEARPFTGRRHQIRRHLKHLSHPVIGDATHGKGPHNRWWATRLGVTRLWLHALSLAVPHPDGGMLRLASPLEAAWNADWRALVEATR